jgi:hypothetical protein
MKECIVCHLSKALSEFPEIMGGEVDPNQSVAGGVGHPSQTQFKNMKRLWICKDCWAQIP